MIVRFTPLFAIERVFICALAPHGRPIQGPLVRVVRGRTGSDGLFKCDRRQALERILVDEDAGTAHVGQRTGPYALVEVSDAGAGMPSEVLARVVDRSSPPSPRAWERGRACRRLMRRCARPMATSMSARSWGKAHAFGCVSPKRSRWPDLSFRYAQRRNRGEKLPSGGGLGNKKHPVHRRSPISTGNLQPDTPLPSGR